MPLTNFTQGGLLAPQGTGSAQINAQRAGQPIQNEPRRGLLSRISGGLTDFSDNLLQFVTSPNGQIALGLLSAAAPSTAPGGAGSRIGPSIQNTLNQMAQRQLFQSQIARNEAAHTGGTSQQAVTNLGKLAQDLGNGVISPEDYQSRREEILQAGTQRGFDNEKVLREEFGKRTKGITDSLQAVSQAEALLASSNPISQMAAFISLIKSIDNSTVREGELRNFSSVSGIVSQLESLVSKTKGEGAFAPGVEKDIKATVAALRGNLEKMLAGFGEFYGGEAERFGLSRNAVVGQPKPEFAGIPSPERVEVSPVSPRTAGEIDKEIAAIDEEIASLKQALKEGS